LIVKLQKEKAGRERQLSLPAFLFYCAIASRTEAEVKYFLKKPYAY
jgi:hypothetical protein